MTVTDVGLQAAYSFWSAVSGREEPFASLSTFRIPLKNASSVNETMSRPPTSAIKRRESLSMIDQAPCAQSGAPVSASTARRMNGLCISCKMKRTRTAPFHVFYNSLIDRVHHSRGGFDLLSEPAKLYFTVMLLRNEVNDGGFHQYFINSSGSYYDYAEKGLIALGATQTLELLRQAKDILFPMISVPVDTEVRRRIIP